MTCNKEILIPAFAGEPDPADASNPSGTMPSTGRQWRTKRAANRGPILRRTVAAIMGVIAIVGVVVASLKYGGSAMVSLVTIREQAMTIANLEQIASALNAYAADHGAYPLPIVRDALGRPMHSWRVAILPYLNATELYQAYDLSKPWDDSENLSLIDSMPPVFGTTNPGSWPNYESTYQLVVGDGTLFPVRGPLSPGRVTDDASKTALVVEARSPGANQSSPSPWTKPTELDLTTMTGAIGSNPGVEIGGVTVGGAGIATVDGSGHFLKETTPPEVVRAILTATGGEALADDAMD